MFNIYNETGKVLKLHTEKIESEEKVNKLFQIGVCDTEEDEIKEFHTISVVKNGELFEMIEEFCGKCKPVTKKTSRFYFRGKDKAIPYYNTKDCSMDAMDLSADSTDEEREAFKKFPRNCLVFVLNKDSKIYMFRKFCTGHFPAKTITVNDDIKILVFFTRYNNWAKGTEPTYIYVEGVNGKKQVRAGFTTTGPNKEFTTNTLFEEDFEGDEFPEDPTPKKEYPKKQFNKNNNGRFYKNEGTRNPRYDSNTDKERSNPKYNQKGNRKYDSNSDKPSPSPIDNFDFTSYGDGIPVKPNKEERRRRNNDKKRRDNHYNN